MLSEVLVFLLIGPRLVRLFAPGGAIALAAVAGIIRWTVAAFTTSPAILAFMQPLHGFTFALLHLAAMQVIIRVVPLRLTATAQAIYGTLCIGLATAVLTLASGLLYGWMGGPAFVMAALCLLALPLCARLHLSRCLHCDPRFCRPAVGHIADRLQWHTLTLCVCSLVAAVAGLGYVMLQSFAGLLLVALAQAAMLAPIVPLSDALATTAARMSESGGKTVRIWMAARVRLRCIHSRHDAEWLGGQR